MFWCRFTVYLVGAGAQWTATNVGGPQAAYSALNATVPGDILTDLQRAGRVEDPYWNTTWQQPDFIAAWNNGTWTYQTVFATPPAPPGTSHFVVFDGIRMGAAITLNDQFLGNATNQFLRYVLPAPLASVGTQNVLAVTFGAELGIDCGGRWTYSAEIDWAPTQRTHDNTTKRSTFGFGIWKSVYVLSIPAGGAAISQLAPTTWYQGGHPTTLLADDDHKGFEVHANVELLAPTPVAGTVSILGNWPGAVQVTQHVRLSKGNNAVAVIIPAAQTTQAKLWHPRGNGNQTLYNISASFCPSTTTTLLEASAAVPTTQRHIGFRHAVLITTNDSDPQIVANAPEQNGTGQFTMFLRVNGAPVYSRGANKIPMDLMEGRMTAVAHRRLVQSAAEANFNALRVWGGGIWEPRAFFDACDEFGIMVYEDAMETFGEVDTEIHLHNDQLQRELEYQVRRLAPHPSVVLYSGCNECIYHDGGALYELLVTTRIAGTDSSRIIWPHSPAPDGWSSGIDRLTTRPKVGQPLVVGVKPEGIGRPSGYNFPMEGHGPYVTAQYSGNFSELVARVMPEPGPVGVFTEFTVGAHENPVAAKSWTGPEYPGWFQSEFGAISWPSFESASPSMPPDQWSVNSAVAHTRNWNPSSFIGAMFGPQNMSTVGVVLAAHRFSPYVLLEISCVTLNTQQCLRDVDIFQTAAVPVADCAGISNQDRSRSVA